MASYGVLEHRESRPSRWLRGNRLRVAFLIALVETALIVLNVVSWYWALALAAIVFLFHFFVGRRARYEWLRQLSWTAAVSQTLPVLIPFVALVVGAFLVLAIVAAAVIVLAYVILGRR